MMLAGNRKGFEGVFGQLLVACSDAGLVFRLRTIGPDIAKGSATMANEITIRHTHDDGWLHSGWDYHKDASVESAAAQLNADARDGLTADELMNFINSALDQGQMTEREARQLSEGLRRHYDQMPADVRAVAEKLDLKLQGLVGNVHDASEDRFRHPGDIVVLEGDRLDSFLDVANMGHPLGPNETAQEFQNEHTHDAGLFRSDWKFYTDASLDLALQKLAADGRDGIDAKELLEFVKGAGDFEQITFREARQLEGALNRFSSQMTPEAQKVAARLREALFEAYPPSRVPANGIFVGNSDILDFQDDERYRNSTDGSNLKGEKLSALMSELNNMANPLQKLGTLIDPNVFAAPVRGDRAQKPDVVKADRAVFAGTYIRG
jgi:hypothetical protein